MSTRAKPAACCTPLEHDRLDDASLEHLVALARVLADPTRLEILRLLAAQSAPVCACDVEAFFDLSQPTISHHLRKLERAGLVDATRQGLWRYYAVAEDASSRLSALAGLLEN